jgi:hypothetical protein
MSENRIEERLAGIEAGTDFIGEEQTRLMNEMRDLLQSAKELVSKATPTRRFLFGRLLGVATTATRLPPFRCDWGVVIKAEGGNAGMAYIGDSSVTAGVGERVGGFELDANQAIILPIRELSDLYFYDTPGGQYVCYFAM